MDDRWAPGSVPDSPVDISAVEDILDKQAAERLAQSETFGRFCENANHHSLQDFLREYDPEEVRAW